MINLFLSTNENKESHTVSSSSFQIIALMSEVQKAARPGAHCKVLPAEPEQPAYEKHTAKSWRITPAKLLAKFHAAPVPLSEGSSGRLPSRARTSKLCRRSPNGISCASSGLCQQAMLIAITARQRLSKPEQLKRSLVRQCKQGREQPRTDDSHVA